ncbi:hypothetical protein NRK99_03265 [Aeromonas dhakensis]|uniref:hypothetical protein n=1 Tax=Aeromonas dhakensis TaxID=196024 RepID=UPI00227A7FA5|nr:hypothetical protein [Aeromonas dhakensis]WAF73321.1 hypothetical protein NRK99_03265 [Aeromonas dhakensis]
MTDDLFELEPPIDELGGAESGPAHMQPPAPVSQLTKHWDVARKEWIGTIHITHATEALLALGAIRAVYWLALGSNEVALAKEIAEWWAECEPLHGLGETIR